MNLPSTVTRGDNSDWGIASDAEHAKIAFACANISLLQMMKIAFSHLKPIKVDLLHYYRRSEIGKLVSVLEELNRLEQEHITKGNCLLKSDRDRFLKGSIEGAGYRSGDVGVLSRCGHCGKSPTDQTVLKACGKCHGAAYCNRDCQLAVWKKHKKECDPLLAQTKKAVSQLVNDCGIELTFVSPYAPSGTLPTGSCVLTETSGAGSVGIIWNPGQVSFLTFSDTNAMMLSGASVEPDLSNFVQFNSLSCWNMKDLLSSVSTLFVLSVSRECRYSFWYSRIRFL